MTIATEPSWPKAALDARAKVLDSIPKYARIDVAAWTAKYPRGSDVRPVAAECGILTPRELELTALENDVTSLVEGIKEKRWTSEELTLAFGKRACIAHQMTLCLVDIFIEDALERARELDAHFAKTGQLIGPLHGVPFAAKEYYKMKGHTSAFGVVELLKLGPQPASGSLIQALEDAGAVFFCRTNIPQIGMQLETFSFYGETSNPCNTALTPGGSSGGCSSLLAFGGAAMSIGGDIGGSLRCPASNCGIWTLKPTTQRVPRAGQTMRLTAGVDGVNGTCGPLTRSLRDIDLFMKVVLDKQPWLGEHLLVPLPWRAPVKRSQPIKIGLMRHDGVVLPQPPILRAFDAMVEKLAKDARFTLVDFAPLNHAQGIDIVHELYFPDGGEAVFEALKKSGEQVLPLTKWVLTRPGVHKQQITEYHELSARRDDYRAKYLEHWNQTGVDVVLCPTHYGAAPPLGTTTNWEYCCIWNLLDYPAMSFPTGLTGDSTRDVVDTNREYMSEEDKRIAEIYDPELVANAPLCLQLVGRRFHDEDLYHVMQEISQSLPLSS